MYVCMCIELANCNDVRTNNVSNGSAVGVAASGISIGRFEINAIWADVSSGQSL